MGWQIHRFRDHVGISNGGKGGETAYLTAREARAMAQALQRAARSIERERFGDSAGNTATGESLPDSVARSQGFPPPLERLPDGRAIGPRGAPIWKKQGETESGK